MSATAWLWAHLSFALLLGGALMPLARRLELPARGREFVYGLAALLSLLPWQGVDLAGRLLAVSDFLSVPTLLLLALHAGWSVERLPRVSRPQRGALLLLAAGSGLVLYVLVLGRFAPDAYLPGYFRDMALLVAALAAVAWIAGLWLVALALLGGLAAWQGGLLESPNLWDYLTDPWLVPFALWWGLDALRSVAKRPQRVGQIGPEEDQRRDP